MRDIKCDSMNDSLKRKESLAPLNYGMVWAVEVWKVKAELLQVPALQEVAWRHRLPQNEHGSSDAFRRL